MPIIGVFRIMRSRGQALAELAIFGSIMLIAMAAIVRYGLNSIYTQEVMQDSFRNSLREAYRDQPGGSGSVSILRDRYIPDPSRPFAQGTRVPFVSGASVNWTNRALLDQIDRRSELPTAVILANRGQPGGVKREYIAANYVAYYTVDPLVFKRVAQLYCGPQTGDTGRSRDRQKQLEQCGKTLFREPRIISPNGTVSWNGQTLTVINITPAQAAGFGITPIDTSIAVEPCAGEIVDAESCKYRCDKMAGHWRVPATGLWILKTPPIDPLPKFCSQVTVPDSDPTNPTGTKVNRARVENTTGIGLANGVRQTAFHGTVTELSSNNQTWDYTDTETIVDRPIRTQVPSGDYGLQEEHLTHRLRVHKSGSWQTPP